MKGRCCLLMLGVAAGCRAAPTVLDVMSAPPVCHSTPRAAARGERLGGVLPGGVRGVADSGVVIGFIQDADTRAVVRGARVAIGPRDTNVAPTSHGVISDSVGAFVLPPHPTGSYVLWIRRIGYDAQHKIISLRPGAVDTMRVYMRQYNCGGY